MLETGFCLNAVYNSPVTFKEINFFKLLTLLSFAVSILFRLLARREFGRYILYVLFFFCWIAYEASKSHQHLNKHTIIHTYICMYREMKGMWTSNKHLTLIFSDSLVNINTHALTWIGGIHTHTLSGFEFTLKVSRFKSICCCYYYLY